MQVSSYTVTVTKHFSVVAVTVDKVGERISEYEGKSVRRGLANAVSAIQTDQKEVGRDETTAPVQS